jgi:hypothetical protein
MDMFLNNDVGVSVDFELTFENVSIIRQLLNDCLHVSSKWINTKENLFLTCWAYHTGENESVPELAPRFVWKFRNVINVTVLDAVLKGESEEKLRELFAGREEEEKQIIITFSTYSLHFKNKHIKQKLRLVDESVRLFLDHGLPEENIIVYNQYEGCERSKRFLEILQEAV